MEKNEIKILKEMIEEEMDLIIGTNGGYLKYANIDFTGIKALKFTLAKAGPYFSGGKMTFEKH